MKKIQEHELSNEERGAAAHAVLCTPRPGMLATNEVYYQRTFHSDLCAFDEVTTTGNRAGYIWPPRRQGPFSISFVPVTQLRVETDEQSTQLCAGPSMIEKPPCAFKHIQHLSTVGSARIEFTAKGMEAIKQKYRLSSVSFFDDAHSCCVVQSPTPQTELLLEQVMRRTKLPDRNPFDIGFLLSELVEAVIKQLVDRPKSVSGHGRLRRSHQLHLATMGRAKAYLLEHLRCDITLAELARHCYMSPYHFTRIFKQLAGESPFHYLQQIRLRYAARLLLHSDLTVAEICFQSGFKRPDYFSSIFTKTFDLSPAKYRLANRSQGPAQADTKTDSQHVQP